MPHVDDAQEFEELSEEASESDLCDLGRQLEHNFASLLLKMQTILHIPESAVQEVIQQLCQLNELSQPLLQSRVRVVLQKYYTDVSETVLKEMMSAVSESNTLTFCATNGPLGTSKRRAAYVRKEFPLVSPIEYVVEKGQKPLAYVPIIHMLQKLLNKNDILDKAMSEGLNFPQEYRSYGDGLCFKENALLTKGEFTIALGLYIDDFEVANPLGTSKLKHKMCAVYWVIANMPAKYRSTLSSIQLALLCNTSTVKQCGYAKVLQPLIYDLKLLEQDGIYLEQLGASVKGTVLYVAADNLGAHSLAGFLESFTTDKFCRFCLASRRDIQQLEMAVQHTLTMRVIVSDGDIRKMTMPTRPHTLDDLIGWLQGTLQTNYNFSLQYQDPEFNNELCNLTDISELPEKPSIKIIPIIEFVPITTESVSDASSHADTDILSSTSLDRSHCWPDIFDIPTFSVDVEYRLRQGNLLYLKDGTFLKVTKELKHDILEKLAETMYAFKAYPTKQDFETVAKALVQAHPCLAESGSPSGCDGWKNSLKFKMGNYRTKMRQLGRLDVSVNAGKRGRQTTNGDPPNKDIKKPRKGEINYLPDYPEGMDDHNLEGARQILVHEMMKSKPNISLVKKEMDVTFALRRKEVVRDKPAISEVVHRWPALFTESQIYCEFTRVVGKNLKEVFFDALDEFAPRLMDLFSKKKGLAGQLLADLLRQTKTTEPTCLRCLCLRGLPVVLGDDPSAFFKTSSDSYSGTPVGLLCVDQEQPQLNPSKVGIILEGNVVMEDLANLPQAFCLLFGLIYALHLDYPKVMKNSFCFIQQVMLKLGSRELPPKIQTLKNKLAV
ncbi:uncharacterized protein LOC125801118 isoform X1 [Astyanax mexicanus]|nr:uncharacterized protein LOC111189885 isoform X1 [Astyanax mexicanus]XP_049333172.1 uncharacterized protein LOC125801118 isoform X1 [Astyanax mexicanus]